MLPAVAVPQSQVAPAVAAPAPGVSTTVPATTPSTTVAESPEQEAVPTTVATADPSDSGAGSTTVPAVAIPDAPAATPGAALATIGGRPIDTELTRSENRLILVAGDMTVTVFGETATGERVALDEDGVLRLDEGDSVVVDGSGFEPDMTFELWMMSTPTALGELVTDPNGAIEGRFGIPVTMEPGEHRIVLSGSGQDGVPVVLAVGIFFGSVTPALWSGIPLWVPVSIAIGLALIVPTRYSRRRRAMTDGAD